MKKEIDMSIFLEDDERYADAVNVFGNMPKGTVTEEEVESYDANLNFTTDAIRKYFLSSSLVRKKRTDMHQRQSWQEGTILRKRKNHFFAKHRDMARRIIFGVNFVIAELELQETVDYSYPLRDMGYTFGEYEQQARKIRKLVRGVKKSKNSVAITNEDFKNQSDSTIGVSQKNKKRVDKPADNQKKIYLRPGEYLYGFRKESRLHPTVIFLLYFGEEPWDGPTSIHDMIDFSGIPNEIRALVQNHRINLIDVRRMSDEMLERFQTDVGKVLRIIKNSEKKDELKSLVENDPYYKEMEQDAYLVAVNYIKADELLDFEKFEEEGKYDMCRAIKELIEDGRMEGRINLLVDLVRDDLINVGEAAKRIGVTEEEFLVTMQTELQNR